MALRNPTLTELRKHRVPAWWQDAKLGIFVHWTPASVPAFAPVDVEIGELLQSGRRDALAWSPYTEWYENSLRFPDSPVAQHHRDGLRRPAVRASSRPTGKPGSSSGIPTRGRRSSPRPARATSCSSPSTTTGTACGRPTSPNPHRPGWHCRRDVVGELGEAVRGAGMRFGLYYSGGLDWTFDDRPMGSLADMLAAIPRGDYPAYAEAQVRELIARYRPSVLWNDIAWPADGKHLWPLFAHYYEQVPDGVVNDRWMPWNPLLGATRLAAGAARHRRGRATPGPDATRASCRRSRRTSTCARPSTPCSRTCSARRGSACAAWTRASATTRSRVPSTSSRSDELLWLLVDIVAKGGNLLLNVGPRGVDAQIPDEQRTRLEWLASWPTDMLRATWPWVVSGEGDLRYVARDDTVLAIVRNSSGSELLSAVGATPTTAVESVDGKPFDWDDTGAGLRVSVTARSADEPVVVVLKGVEARAR